MYWEGLFLVGELDVDEGRDCLDRCRVLCMVEEVSMAGLELWVPLDDIELLACLLRALLLSLGAFSIACKGRLGLKIKGMGRGAGVRVERHSSKLRRDLLAC